VLSTEIYQDALVLQNWPFAASLAIILIFIVLAVLVAQNTFVQHSRYRVVFH
jgi:ABC-type Fe3+ transport system permease subunit